MKLLILALSGIGDALMFTPALSLLKNAHPGIRIDAVVMYKGVSDIYRRTGFFDNVYYFDFLNSSKFKSLMYVLNLRNNSYTHSINVYPSNRKEYNLISFLIHASKRGGVSYLRNNFVEMGFLNNVTVTENDSLHNVEENVELIAKMFGIQDKQYNELVFNLTPTDNSFADNYLAENNLLETQFLIGMHPGCSTLKNHINRRWDTGKFAELIDMICHDFNARVLIFGGPDEENLKQEIISKVKKSNPIAVRTENLAQSASLIKKCNLFITNDSSLMHVSASQQTPTIALIGPTNTNYIKPWKTEYEIASLNLECSPCFIYSPKPLNCTRSDIKYKCVKELTPGFVMEKVRKFLK